MVTYCSVCHTGRVYEPMVNGEREQFRLVGMDHFNAMFEDKRTESWWQQSTGQAVTGRLKGVTLPEVSFEQMGLGQWFKLFPNGVVLQQDNNFRECYDSLARYEKGKSKGSLSRKDSLSWKPQSWVVGVSVGQYSKAYDWNTLLEKRIINDQVGDKHIVLFLANDNKSFMAFERPKNDTFVLLNDTLLSAGMHYNLIGQSMDDKAVHLKRVSAYQEFWHSWKTTFPKTSKYP